MFVRSRWLCVGCPSVLCHSMFNDRTDWEAEIQPGVQNRRASRRDSRLDWPMRVPFPFCAAVTRCMKSATVYMHYLRIRHLSWARLDLKGPIIWALMLN